MLGISKNMVFAAAVIAFGIVSLDDMAKVHATGAIVHSSTVRQTAPGGGPVPAASMSTAAFDSRKQPKSMPAPNCRAQAWPYFSRDCLSEPAGVRTATVRVIPVDRLEDSGTQP